MGARAARPPFFATSCPTAGETFCTPLCTNTNIDQTNCGKCGNNCIGGAFCVAANCQCNGGFIYCLPDGCVNPKNDPAHCGTCPTACKVGQSCVQGICQ